MFVSVTPSGTSIFPNEASRCHMCSAAALVLLQDSSCHSPALGQHRALVNATAGPHFTHLIHGTPDAL